jgi:hypothetical protein
VTAGGRADSVPAAAREAESGREWPIALAVAAVAGVIAWLRMPLNTLGQLYAEDGRTFFGDWFTHGSVALLREPYAGYQHLLPRLASGLIAWPAPVSGWAVAVNLVVCLILGGVAGLVHVCARAVVALPAARIALGLIVVVVPIAGFEGLGNLANLHWFLLYLVVWVLLAVPRSTAAAWGLAVVALLCTATEPQAAIFLPLAAWAVIRRRGVWPVTLGWSLGVAAQVLTTALAPRAIATDYPPFASTVQGYILNAGMTLGTWRPGWLGRVLTGFGWWPGVLGVALILGLAAVGVTLGAPRARVAILALLYGSVLSWTASFVLGSNPAFFYSEYTAEQLAAPMLVRWATAASMFLVATIPVTLGVLVARRPGRRVWASLALGGLLTIMLLGGVAGQLSQKPLPGDWAATVEAARAFCAASPDGVVKLATPPSEDWTVPVPCDRIVG